MLKWQVKLRELRSVYMNQGRVGSKIDEIYFSYLLEDLFLAGQYIEWNICFIL